MTSVQTESTRQAGASLDTLPVEILTQILDELVSDDAAPRNERIMEGARITGNLVSLLPLLRTNRRLYQLARDRLHARIRLTDEKNRIQQFAFAIEAAHTSGRPTKVLDLDIDAFVWDDTRPVVPEGTPVREPPFLHLCTSLQSLYLLMSFGRPNLKDMIHELPTRLDLFPHLEHCTIQAGITITPCALLPFWGAPQLQTLCLEEISIPSTERDEDHQKLLLVASRSFSTIKPLKELTLFDVSLRFNEEALAAVTGLRDVTKLQTERLRTNSSEQRVGWRNLIASLAPGLRDLVCIQQDIGNHPPEPTYNREPSQAYEIPQLGALACVKSLKITEQLLENALGMRQGDSERDHRLPSSVEHLSLEIQSNRMTRPRLYPVLTRLLEVFRARHLHSLVHLELFFRRVGSERSSIAYEYNHELIDTVEAEARGLTGSDGYEFRGGRTLEHKAFEGECERLELRVSSSSNIIVPKDDG